MLDEHKWDIATFLAFTKLECSFYVSEFTPGLYSETEISNPHPMHSELTLILPSQTGLGLPKQLVSFRFSD